MRVLQRISGLLAVGVLATVGLLRASDSGDRIVFRDLDEFASLNAVLSDPTSWGELRRLSGRYALWSLFTLDSTVEGENGEVETTDGHVHHFRFGSRKGLSSRRFEVSIRTDRRDDGSFAVVGSTRGFVTRTDDIDDNVSIQERPGLQVFRRFLEHPSVRGDLAGHELLSARVGIMGPEQESTVDIQVVTLNDPEAGTSNLRYRLGFDRVSGTIEWIERSD
ncbi:MAG: hypothetical protein O7J95_02580 [Planctomycetota bacterium]|nr:hypothetical protein [Planctomycetota bacterium]